MNGIPTECSTEMWRFLKTGGLRFIRLACSIGIEDKIKLIQSRRYWQPDVSELLVDEEFLLDATAWLGGVLAEPIKTTNVQNLRCITAGLSANRYMNITRN